MTRSSEMTTKRSYRTGGLIALATALAAVSAPMFSVATTQAANVQIDLCAGAGTTIMPNGASIAVWGYRLGDCSTGSITAPGGPILSVAKNDVVTIMLHNSLPEATSLLLQGQPMPPDTVGAPAAVGTVFGTKSYTFAASKPGTFLYEAGFIKNAVGGTQHQVAMGLYGALIVRPAAGQAYDTLPTTSSAYDKEGVVVLGEIDTALNNSANKAAFDMRNFKAKYFTINGKAYSKTDLPIAAPAVGETVLLRYVNAGMSYHSMSLLGGSQQIIAYDGNLLKYPHTVAAETFGPGQTVDALVRTTGMAAGSKLAVYDANLLLNNSTATGFGGMLAYINVGSGAAGSSGPATSAVAVTPNPATGSVDVGVSATVSDVASGGSNVTGAEYFIDTAGAPGTGQPMTGAFTSPTETVSAAIPAATVVGLSNGSHTILVRGKDSVGNWGSPNLTTLTVDHDGPSISLMTLVPNPSNGSANVGLHATASDVATGGGNIVAAEYSIDGVTVPTPAAIPPALPVPPITVNYALPTASLDATILAAKVNSLLDGPHAIAVRAQDSRGNWGAWVSINLVVDKTGPAISGLSANPAATNGVVGYNSSVPAVRIFATAIDGVSNVVGLEGFIDTPAPVSGTGFVFFPADTGFDSKTESALADIPLTTVLGLTSGSHTISVHGKDASGNWGPLLSTTLAVDRQAPTVSAPVLSPAATNNSAVTISASATDALTGNLNIAGGEYFVGTLGTNGTGTPMTAASALPTTTISGTLSAANVTGLTPGLHAIYIHARDSAGNWSATVTINLLIDRTAPTFTGITVVPNSILNGTASTTMTVVGASDGAGGSGVTGGEYWFDTASITAGTGTAFTGLSAPISTATLTSAVHTVRVRIRDAAGNWSTSVQSAPLTVTGDFTPPTFSTITLTPTSILQGTASVTATVNGAADNADGTGVYGGEYWIGNTNITAGTGAQFTGLTASVPTDLLSAGTYTVRVRIRDGAGNWSTAVHTAQLSVFTDAIFSNGFESGTIPGAWSARSTTTTSRLNVTGIAAVTGSWGLQAQGNNTNYVQYNFGTATIPLAATFDAKFSFRPNGNTATVATDIFSGRTAGGATAFRVRYRLSGVTPQVQIQIGGTTTNTVWTAISPTVNTIEVVWQAAGSGGPGAGSLVLYVNGVSSQTLATTSTNTIGSVRLGSVSVGSSATLMYFDNFASKRSVTPYGP